MTIRYCWWFGFIIALGSIGCSKSPDRLPTFPVKGAVTYNGALLGGADVVLVPSTPNAKLRIPPHAVTGSDGVFRVKTYDPDDGAPAGDYHIIVSRNDEDPDDPGDAFRGKFNNHKKPPAKFTIRGDADGEQEIPPLTLTGPKVKLPSPSK
ncbi:MAG: hypothetical protein QM811_19860 [Pirellulales bacterium]